jgi:hypothetical protein
MPYNAVIATQAGIWPCQITVTGISLNVKALSTKLLGCIPACVGMTDTTSIRYQKSGGHYA